MPTTPEEDATFARKINGMSSDAVERILSVEPYKGGDDVLWRLHALNNRDKHRLLCTVGASMGHWSITQHIDATDMPLSQMERLGRAYAASDFNDIMREGTFPLEKGQIIFVDAPDAKENPDFKFRPEVVINEPTICEGKPVISVLDASFRRVVEVVKMFDGLY